MSRAVVQCLGEHVGVSIDAGGSAPMPPSPPPWRSASRRHDVTRKPSKHQACRRDLDERLARLHTALVILGQTPIANQPGETSLNDSPARMHLETLGAWLALHDLRMCFVEHGSGSESYTPRH